MKQERGSGSKRTEKGILQDQFEGLLEAWGVNRPEMALLLPMLRRCFFGGAVAFYASGMGMLSEGQEPTDEDMAVMRALHEELEGFAEDVREGKA